MCKPLNITKYYCDRNYSAGHRYATEQKWRACGLHKHSTPQGQEFIESDTLKPCSSAPRLVANDICPDCTHKFASYDREVINSHCKAILRRMSVVSGHEFDSDEIQGKVPFIYWALTKHENYRYLQLALPDEQYNSGIIPDVAHFVKSQLYTTRGEIYKSELSNWIYDLMDRSGAEVAKLDGCDPQDIMRNNFMMVIAAEIKILELELVDYY